ncbi:phosphoribosylaminoimidazolesuccinocarboxamide synthase [Candidatus Curtissbacteria bacterium RIFCSPHIGHO2_01_FULL_41_44]|uniref:Phosphoribosylaminoimidazole-succinocarboxamide synthase n=1 Tax=Candidatus Curtissbacteria bacterium RIFCSPLOWO2_01_FULL_42_50 TaxID=1797730 RepID=A0A1F5H535_9BACT|nr:MAG: phosphoribosylaminoimidazolesuccinocarboxamide synthase [Candidatus Curtissbacteria bacterium RIFCSPHIGHO2_02_FULL_42_58]OGD93851.1 MAG: phosphoribosylaminoimidazolesuccinocarboxamide synthase [Candidatus Curtissbacteria bacterium RIFCSPHIGHO2_01_FULL_41_44]OGD97498.1 MAG: phosphoribosylaminoimidazolesuccinocarboxamide synthase [Candidatus Curtissbacteria bacterium RIFCSPHIGHO2_12_FULL_42_33]OGD99276.1 MAG: phosphoribosylaminoimidazolesuccinocarboxamide synthase [Candidatus Curtissbacter
MPNSISEIKFPRLGKRYKGKVRDWYIKNHLRILIATDRISAFDKVLGNVPFRGAVLNSLSYFWFEKTRDIVPNHMIGIIDPNVMLVTECQALPVEVVVRGYITGVTGTSLWKHYSDGERLIYGIKFPEGLSKNQKLGKPVITPTTRGTGAGGHDEPITPPEIIKKKLVPANLWKQIEKIALIIFERGTRICEKAGFILADTKYEFGLDRNGKLALIDEIHTPDSSRLWVKKTYQARFKKGEEVENYDKEFMRIWFRDQGYTGRGKIPQMPETLIAQIASRYIEVYEKITGDKFSIDLSILPKQRILESLSKLI